MSPGQCGAAGCDGEEKIERMEEQEESRRNERINGRNDKCGVFVVVVFGLFVCCCCLSFVVGYFCFGLLLFVVVV